VQLKLKVDVSKEFQNAGLSMQQDMKSVDWEKLMPFERIARCRALASEALERAAVADSAMRKHYLELASEWTRLADEMERLFVEDDHHY
jgi:hypothetical protein